MWLNICKLLSSYLTYRKKLMPVYRMDQNMDLSCMQYIAAYKHNHLKNYYKSILLTRIYS